MATLIYDGDCGICTAAVNWGYRWLKWMPEVVASQSIDPGSFGLTAKQVAERVWLVDNATRWGGHEAIAALLTLQEGFGWRLLGAAVRTPPTSWLARFGYAIVARNRHRIRVGDQQCAIPDGSARENAQLGTAPRQM